MNAHDAGEGLVSVAEAAALLHVSQSTLWRWIDQEAVRAYRIGPKRVWLKRADLARLRRPARGQVPKRGGERPLSRAERERGLAAIEAARAFQAELLQERQGAPFPPGWQALAEARDERLRQRA